MAKGPAVVIVARHGARLDAADKRWHLTSPAPYDPPLTYGGWTQSKALGLRIATLLHERSKEAEAGIKANGANADLAHLDFSPLDAENEPRLYNVDASSPPKRRQRIVIHTSPFLRCVQTSTAIAAGISQFQAPATSTLKVPKPRGQNGVTEQSPLSRSSPSKAPAVQPVETGPAADPKLEVYSKKHIGPDKILLRIDAFLGEWLSPDYYTDITPPPSSVLMVAGAKADLLRKGEYIEVQQNVQNSHGHFPGGWARNGSSPSLSRRSTTQDSALATMGSLALALPRERSSSQGCLLLRRGSRSWDRPASPLMTTHKAPDHVYDPPVPSYAVSPSDSIPRGYTAHARDACLDVDFQWDSTRPPQGWGNGGDYGDEWSTMHKRFRKGLSGMMTWYKAYGCARSKDRIRGLAYREHKFLPLLQHNYKEAKQEAEPTVDDDEEIVLILVTHGAGCNALLGAITNQPVLLDVGMASLSMAVQRSEPRRPSISSPTSMRRPSLVDPGVSNEYELKIVASMDHLRPGVDPAKPPQPLSPANMASPTADYRRRFTGSGAANSPVDSPISLGQPWRGLNSSLGSIRRSSTSGSSQFYSGASQGSASPSLGLWSSTKTTPKEPSEGRNSPGSESVSSFRDHKSATTNSVYRNGTANASVNGHSTNGHAANGYTRPSKQVQHPENDEVPPLPMGLGRSQSQSQNQQGLWAPKVTKAPIGLWGPPRLEEVAEHAKGPKRRWTISEREQ